MIKKVNEIDESALRRKKGRKAFWDTDLQKAKAYSYCKNHGLDFNNEQIKVSMREMYRLKDARKTTGYPQIPDKGINGSPRRNFINAEIIPMAARKGGKSIESTIQQVVVPALERTLDRSTTSREATAQQLNQSPDRSPEKPQMTNRVWKGEKWLPSENRFEDYPKPHARMDFFAWYCEFVLPMRRNAIAMGSIHEKWCEEVESDDRVLMFKPRDHYKTSLISIGYSTYQLCEHQFNLFPVLIISKADLNTKDTFQSIRDNLERNERILSFYGYMINDNLQNTNELLFTKFQNVGDKDPALYCGTFGSKKVMGTHPMLAILDDIEESILSGALMYQAKKLLDKSLISGLPKNAKLVLLGTIKGFDKTNDIYLYAKAKGTFSCYEDPAVYKINPITKQPILDAKGQKIWGIVEMKYVVWEKRKVAVIDNATGLQEKHWNGTLKWKWVIWIDVLEHKDDEWMSIYPERYTVKDIIQKRIETREVDKLSDDTFWSEFFLIPRKPGGNYFKSEKIHAFPPRNHATTMAFLEWIHVMHIPTVLWIDPGGKNSHGIAMACVLFWKGDVIIIDLAVIRKGVLEAAKLIAKWVMMYNVQVAGCESNYEQGETFAEPIDKALDAFCTANKCPTYYVKITPIANRGDKILRIQTQFNIMMGYEGTDSNLWVNQSAEDYQQFIDEYEMFPMLLPGVAFEWDLMDCVASTKIHLEDMMETLEATYSYS